ncbi:hypothetical protein SG34_000110 [Thalassomonas viridans]|uniref:Uncharacterized protein n=1 Tax=Thalassomonas viridans TaxID=137584 RepID=A0AAE9Z332_9GAMM|nr:hypothetical protein [Thalassomonas viridans]WDE05392.1 hypothetical protein SG34_000110 [Thalassomonas viridans]
MPEELWFLSHLVLALSALYFAVKHADKRKQVLHIAAIGLLGACYYLVVTWLYVIQSGIDSV